MEPTHHPYIHSLSNRGYIQGSTLTSTTGSPLCHYFGGLRYALAPVQRWCRATKLPASYTYGSRERPGVHGAHISANVCPQPGFRGPADETGWSEDCFQCNVYVPVGEVPEGGWPVLIYIHGGWLQFGTPNTFSVAGLLGETPFKAVVLMPAYRLNVFGFLYSAELEDAAATTGEESVGNHGFWDQRLALEWTKENVHLFGGNPGNITLSGYSAGAYSVFHQLAYDLRQPAHTAIIKRACIWSNGPGVQPKSPHDAQKQFRALCSALNIPATLSSAAKLARLRSIPSRNLLAAATSIPWHQYRPTTDDVFIDKNLLRTVHDGSFGASLRKRGINLLLGECADEHFLYAIWFPPSEESLHGLRQRLIADYPAPFVDAILPLYLTADGSLPTKYSSWSDLFGYIYADMQVHTPQRGLIHSLQSSTAGEQTSPTETGKGGKVYRYKFSYRLTCIDAILPIEWGVTHSTDMPIWFWGNSSTGSEGVLTSNEKEAVSVGIVEPFSRFVNGAEDIKWRADSGRGEVRVLGQDGRVRVQRDERWDEGMEGWGVLGGVEYDCCASARVGDSRL